MKKTTFLFIAFCVLLFSCNTDDSLTKEEEMQNLTNLYDEIISDSMVNTTACTNPEEWSFTAIGSKACGGSSGYIPYSLKINVTEFLKKVEAYSKAQTDYNQKWGIISTCDVLMPPAGIDCVDGKPTLIYSTNLPY